MIYLVLYAIKRHDGETIGGLYFGWANSLSDAEKLFTDIVLTPTCYRKEIWSDDGKGYRRLIKNRKIRYEEFTMLIEVPRSFSETVLVENGLDHEAIVCIEELSELQKEITKFLRGKGNLDALASEIADVYICLNTLEIGTQISYRKLEKAVKAKIDRYYKRRKEGDVK